MANSVRNDRREDFTPPLFDNSPRLPLIPRAVLVTNMLRAPY